MRAGQVGQLHQVSFGLFDDDALEIYPIHLGSALGGSLSRLGLVVMDEVLVADGFKDSEALDEFVQTFLCVDYRLFVAKLH